MDQFSMRAIVMVVKPKFIPVRFPEDQETVIDLLTSNDWPFHGISRLDRTQATNVQIAGPDTASFWVESDGDRVGLVRAFDLDDLVDGSPLFDIRIATTHRNCGMGRFAVNSLTDYLFDSQPILHRIEATTRHDNDPMKAVLHRCGYRQEGRLVQAWRSSNGERFDTLVYAVLRSEWVQSRSR
jgi:RimJ/RimL family protein N-acetyltransferase